MRSSAVVLLLAACATTPVRPLPPRPAERSSVDAVLSHRGELTLSADQVTRLQSIDEAREAEVTDLRAQLKAHREGTPRDGAAPGGPGMGGGGRGMGRGAGRGGGRRPEGGNPARDQVLQKIDDADTRAFLSAEAVLTEAQRPRARELASSYRAALFDFREAMKQRHQAE